MIRLTPKAKRNISRIIPFAVIWVLCGWVIIITEVGLSRNQNLNPETDIAFTIPVLIFANIANVVVGLLVGTLEVVYLEKRFAFHSLRAKIFYKFLIYLVLFLVIIIGFYPVAFSLETGIGLMDVEAWNKLGRFLNSVSFATTLFQLSVSLFVCLVYSAVSENLGHHVFLNFFTGKYHKPVVEERVFMFLDMKSSTTIAEALGHVQYFKLLRDYYNLMSDPIIDSLGEVYQYIGDEIVVSWDLDKGIQDANCIRCFFDIRDSLSANQKKLQSKYGHEIDFKAGIHLGEVTIGEIGALKKEIAFTGDVLNTTARIQSLCKEYKADLLISGELKETLPEESYTFTFQGKIALKGKNKKADLYSVGR
jgi:adenylate cyclase